MALRDTIHCRDHRVNTPALDRGHVKPVSPGTGWIDAITAGGMDNTDDPADPTSWVNEFNGWIKVEGEGTLCSARMAYPRADTVTTNPVVVLIGRTRNADDDGYDYFPLYTVETTPSKTSTLAVVEESDIDDGTTFHYTDADPKTNTFDVQGADDVLLLVTTPAAGGTPANSKGQVRFF